MSITSLLKDKNSHVSEWVRENFTLNKSVQSLTKQYQTLPLGVSPDAVRTLNHFDELNKLLGQQSDDLLKPIVPPGKKFYPWSAVGRAVEHGLRQSTLQVDFTDTGAMHAAINHAAVPILKGALAVWWKATARNPIVLEDAAWVLYFSALLENVYRNADELRYLQPLEEVFDSIAIDPEWIAFYDEYQKEGLSLTLSDMSLLEDLPLLMPAPRHVINDIMLTTNVAIESDWWMRAVLATDDYIDNPSFAGSHWVQGADADMLVGHELIEVKTTIHPEQIWTETLKQLISYVALDFTDEYTVDSLGIFLPRQYGQKLSVSLDEVLTESTFSSRRAMQSSFQKLIGEKVQPLFA